MRRFSCESNAVSKAAMIPGALNGREKLIWRRSMIRGTWKGRSIGTVTVIEVEYTTE